MVKEQSRTRILDGEEGCTHSRLIHQGVWVGMSVVEVGSPAGMAFPGRVAVERFAVLVSAMGAGVGRLDTTDTAALLIKTLMLVLEKRLNPRLNLQEV